MTKHEDISIHLTLIQNPGEHRWGFCWAMGNAGGSEDGGEFTAEATLLRAYRRLRKEMRIQMETKEDKATRLARSKEALKRAKEKGLIP